MPKSEFVLQNLRLRELRIVVETNKPIFCETLDFLKDNGFPSFFDFAMEPCPKRGLSVLEKYFRHNFNSELHNGIGTPYLANKAKWYLMSWVFRDAPVQRLGPILSSIDGSSREERQCILLNEIRVYVAPLFPQRAQWEWACIAEVMLARLEGSRRALKGGLFENMVRVILKELFKSHKLSLTIAKSEVRLDDETYDIEVSGPSGKILIPVKTRETMGGGHALLFTRDIHKAITVASEAGNVCFPLIIAESWNGDLNSLPCDKFIYIKMNPNQLTEIRLALMEELDANIGIFETLC